MSEQRLHVGFGVMDITPAEGLLMAGGLDPRVNEGTLDPLKTSALYASCGEAAVVIVGADLISMPRPLMDRVIDAIVSRTGLARSCVLVSCSHTHSGPYTNEPVWRKGVIDADYVGALPDRIATCVERAVAGAKPATMHLGRSLVYSGLHHRRVIGKHDGLAVNTWMPHLLNDLDAMGQVLGAAGCIDPELWVARFDDADGRVLGTLVNFSLHANAIGGMLWSADYPGAMARQVGEAFGPEAVTVFTPGACGNINPAFNVPARQGIEELAGRAVEAARNARPIAEPVTVAAVRSDLTVPRRDPYEQRDGAIERLNWAGAGGRSDVFSPRVAAVAALDEQLPTTVSAARIGPLGIATNPGELFVELGIEIKRRSPLPHTIVAELTNDSMGYQPDERGFACEGYETLVGPNRIAPRGIAMLVDEAVTLLEKLGHREES